MVNGKFVDENPVNGSPGSLIPAVWGNAVTEELLNVVQAGGLEPAEAERDQLLRAIQTIVKSSLPPEQIRTTLTAYGITDAYTKAEVESLFKNATALPVGAMMAFPKGVVPNGFLEVDGSVQSAATYPDLAAYLGTTFNKGDEGTGNFRLPESRGEFLRGWDHGRGVDAGRGVGSYQAGAVEAHSHAANYYNAANNAINNSFSRKDAYSPAYTSGVTAVTMDASGGGAETRPRNWAVMWCIKAWNAPVNQGQIDVAALVDEVQKLKASVPIGSMLSFPKGVVPPGYLEVDGSVQSAATYPDLYAYLGTTFNTGSEPAGFFRLPESRGEFLRGWDHGRGVDLARGVGSYQLDAMQGHRHSPLSSSTAFTTYGIGVGGAANGAGIVDRATTGDPVTDGVSGAPRTGSETRPRNMAVMWCIKAWNAPTNQGNIDVAALAAQVQSVQKVAVVGSHKGLTASASGLNSLVSVSAEQLVVGNEVSFRNLNAVSLNINAAVVGVNGLDTGALAASTWYSLWVIWNGTVTSGLLSLSATSPTLPSGYTHKARVGWIRTDATSNKYPLSFTQVGRRVQYKVTTGSNVASLPVMASATGNLAAWSAVAVGNYLPPTAPTIDVGLQVQAAGAQIAWASIVPNNAYSTTVSINTPAALTAGTYQALTGGRVMMQLESSSIYWTSVSSTGGAMTVYCAGWEDAL
nr:phage tail protein [Pseudomonas gingeri]